MQLTPRYRLIALDMDGTTLDPRGNVSPRTREAIAKVAATGTYVAFATGRNFTESKRVLEQANHYPKSVFVGGASIVDTASGTSLKSHTMRPDLARELCQDFEAMGHAVLALQDSFTTGIDYLISEGLTLDAATQKWMELTRATVRWQTSLGTYAHQQTLRVGIVCPREESARVNEMLEDKYTGRAVMHSIAVPPQGVDVVEVFDPAVSKWEGVQYLAGTMNITGDEVIAIGDDINDLPMLRQAGLGVAMGNAHPRAKEAAKLTIRPNGEDGLAQFLESLIEEDRLAPA